METEQPSTMNDFMFGTTGDLIMPHLPVVITSREQAYRTAAWLSVMALSLPDDGSDFDPILNAIMNT